MLPLMLWWTCFYNLFSSLYHFPFLRFHLLDSDLLFSYIFFSLFKSSNHCCHNGFCFFFFFGPFPGVNLHKKYTLRDACVCVRVCVCVCVCVCLVTQSCPISCDPMDCSPPVSSVHGILCKNTGVGCHFLLQMIFLTQGSNPGLLLCRQILYHLNL